VKLMQLNWLKSY